MNPHNPFKESIIEFITGCGEDPESETFKDTPERFYKGLQELCGGYKSEFQYFCKVFPNEYKYNSLILSKNIEFHSLCGHHVLPFYGYAHIGYIPGSQIYGLSKLAKAVDIFSKRLQEQEKLTTEIAEILMNSADIQGVVVLMEGRHLCSCGRGVKKPQSSMMTICQKGSLTEEKNLRLFMDLVEDRLHL